MVVGLVLAGGYATRLRPTSLSTPKHLIPLANKPVIGYVLEDLAAAGAEEVHVIVGPHNGDAIREYVGDGSRFGLTARYIVQEKPMGIAHAVSLAEKHISEDFIAYLGDNLIQGGASRYLSRAKGHDAFLLLKEVEDPSRFGVAVLDSDGKLTRLVEKPREPPSKLALMGVYFLTPAFFDYTKRLKPSWRGEYEITDALDLMMRDGRSVGYAIHEGWWLDVGKKDDVLAANAVILDENARREVRGAVENSRLEGRVLIEEGAVVRNSVVRGPAVIGRGSTIDDSLIGPYTSIGDDCVIRRSAVEYSVLMEGCAVEGVERIEESIIGRHARIIASGQRSIKLHVSDYSIVEI